MPPNMKYTLLISLLLQSIAVTGFICFVNLADQAMGKDGVGDFEKFSLLNKYASACVYTWLSLWTATIIVASSQKVFSSKEGQLAVGVPPVFLIGSWLLTVLN